MPYSATSREFVQIKVGNEQKELMLPMISVWNRPYFRDAKAGVMHFTRNEGNIWTLTHPGLVNIDPEDFAFVAEYLESGGFGLRHPLGPEENDDAFAQCVSAWATADTLGMTDLMDHVIDKLEQRMEPELYDMMAFACRFYQDLSITLPVHERLRDFLATYLARNFWIYIRDDHLSSTFIDRLQALPELEHDIYVRRTVALRQQLQSDDGEEEQNDDGTD